MTGSYGREWHGMGRELTQRGSIFESWVYTAFSWEWVGMEKGRMENGNARGGDWKKNAFSGTR